MNATKRQLEQSISVYSRLLAVCYSSSSLFRYFKKKFLRRLRAKTSAGFTLVEMSLAIGIAASMSVLVMSTIADGMAKQGESDRLAIAVSLAQTKLAQLLSNPNLSTSSNKGSFGDDSGIYRGYTYDVTVREEKIDLAKVAETGELKGVPVKDQLPPSQSGAGAPGQQSAGQSVGSQTGGLVDIVRIIVKINYPIGGGASGEYRVETFRDAKKESSGGSGGGASGTSQ